jgi:hypothetical protein
MRASTRYGRLLLLLVLSACSSLPLSWRRNANQRIPSTVAEADARIRELVNLEGEYLLGDGVISLGENELPIGAIAAADTIAIRHLVACLSDNRRSRVTLHKQRVPVGTLCAEALLRTAYVQTGGRRRQGAESWPGSLSMTTDSLELGRLQRAWFQWLHEHQLAWAQPPGSPPVCPPSSAIRAERSRRSVSTSGGAPMSLCIRETLAHFRFVTYVVDSEYVILLDTRARSASDSMHVTTLGGLSADYIENISILKESDAWKWRACDGVPLVLIATKSKRWRPHTSH